VPVPLGFLRRTASFAVDAQARALLLLCTQNKTVQVRGLASLQLLQTLTDSSGSRSPTLHSARTRQPAATVRGC
jgi:hypothetical protein